MFRFFAFLFVLTASVNTLPAAPPNVVLILVDDLGKHDLGVEGSTFYRTPNVDALAASGMRFTNAYAGSRVCSPSRATLLLGQFPARHGITQFIGGKSGMDFNRGDRLLSAEYRRELPADDVTLAEAMRQDGYQTFFAGKWHLGGNGSLPTDHGFDVNVGGHDRGSPPGGFFVPYKNPKMKDGPPGENLTRRLGRETADYIRNSADDEKPFFAMLAFYAVHAPIQTDRETWRKYRDAAPAAGGDRYAIDRTLPVRQVQDNPVYAGLVEAMDSAVGDVLAAIDDAEIRDNTMVIFTSDNGGVSSGDNYSTSNLPLRGGKGRQWEGGIREPLYISYPPMIAAGSTCDVAVSGADIYPTVLQVCDLDERPGQHLDGRSIVPLLTESTIDPTWAKRPLIWHYPHYDNQGGEPSSLIRIGDYKVILYHVDGHSELYDLSNDIGEQHDLANQMPGRTSEMTEQLVAYLKSVDAKFPEADPRFNPIAAARRLANQHGQLKERLENQAAAMLQPDWQPNADWWGSVVD